MVPVFLSHSSKDKPFVRDLALSLESDGLIKVWLDEREIAPGQNIVSRIGERLPLFTDEQCFKLFRLQASAVKVAHRVPVFGGSKVISARLCALID